MDAPYLYRSLVFGAVCGLYRLIEGFEKQEIDIEKVIAVGGISKKSPYVMQMLSDLSGREIHILDSDQTCAQGAAMYAAVGAGIYETLEVEQSIWQRNVLRFTNRILRRKTGIRNITRSI